MSFCPRCGRYNREGREIRFCPYCGSQLNINDVSKTNVKPSLLESLGIISDDDEQVLFNADVYNSAIPIPKSREKIVADAVWLRPFGLFNYLFASAEKGNGAYYSYKYIAYGKLIITNKRIIVLEGQGFLTLKLVPILFIDLNSVSIRAISVSKNFGGGSNLLITYESPDKTLYTMEFNLKESYNHLSDVISKLRESLKMC